jgi:hypothetical protein
MKGFFLWNGAAFDALNYWKWNPQVLVMIQTPHAIQIFLPSGDLCGLRVTQITTRIVSGD